MELAILQAHRRPFKVPPACFGAVQAAFARRPVLIIRKARSLPLLETSRPMFRVLITDSLSAAGLEVLKQSPKIEVDVRSGLSPEQVRKALHDADGIIIRSATKLTSAILKDQPRLKAIVRAGVGVDNIDLPAATRRHRRDEYSGRQHDEHRGTHDRHDDGPLAEYRKGLRQHARGEMGTQQVHGHAARRQDLGDSRPGTDRPGSAQRARGLEMRVLGYDPFLSPERASEQRIELFRDIDAMLPLCDYLTVHTPLTNETRGVINADRLRLMKKGVRVINCPGRNYRRGRPGRGAQDGTRGGAALDVFVEEPPKSSPLPGLPNVLCTPHLGASTDEAQELVAIEAAEILAGYFLETKCGTPSTWRRFPRRKCRTWSGTWTWRGGWGCSWRSRTGPAGCGPPASIIEERRRRRTRS